MDAAGVLWEAAESADTRCWGLLPREIQVLRIELPAGRHRLSLGPLQGGRKIGGDQAIDIEIIDGRNSYALSYFPDSQPIGPIQVSRWASICLESCVSRYVSVGCLLYRR